MSPTPPATSSRRWRLAPILLLAALLGGAAQAQSGGQAGGQAGGDAPKPDADADAPQDPKKLKDWPAIAAPDRARALKLTGQLKKESEELRQAAVDEMIAIGAGAAPVLFQKVNDSDESINEDLFRVFDAVLGPEHADLMAAQARKKKRTLRNYLTRRLCRFVDPDQRDYLAWASKDEEDEQVVFCANLGLAALHDAPALLQVLELTRRDWLEHKDLVAEVLPAARCDACARAVAEHIASAQPVVQAAGLRLLRYVADQNHVMILRTYLGAEDHGVKKEAVNAMRALHGQEPIENLSAFQAVEMAKEWQSK
ncbi:MAG: hypothetical protein AB7O97_23860 [Planctomycetota bacterium]